jgi:hypothetical protein
MSTPTCSASSAAGRAGRERGPRRLRSDHRHHRRGDRGRHRVMVDAVGSRRSRVPRQPHHRQALSGRERARPHGLCPALRLPDRAVGDLQAGWPDESRETHKPESDCPGRPSQPAVRPRRCVAEHRVAGPQGCARHRVPVLDRQRGSHDRRGRRHRRARRAHLASPLPRFPASGLGRSPCSTPPRSTGTSRPRSC